MQYFPICPPYFSVSTLVGGPCSDPCSLTSTNCRAPCIASLRGHAAVLQILRGLKGVDIVGMDIVEVAPSYDHAEITALAAATLATELLYLQVERP